MEIPSPAGKNAGRRDDAEEFHGRLHSLPTNLLHNSLLYNRGFGSALRGFRARSAPDRSCSRAFSLTESN
jgi:hypothetical protein